MERPASITVTKIHHWFWRVVPVAIVLVLSLGDWTCAADKVLILNSYHRGKRLSDDTITAIITGLPAPHPELTLLVEDMDTKRNSLEDVKAPLLECFTQKYRDVDLAAVVTIDNNAFDFAIENRSTLFPGVPLVFCGFNGFQRSMLDGIQGVTGVAEAVEFEATIKVALALHPQTTHLAVVSDTTPSGRKLMGEFRRYAGQLPASLQIVELAELESADLSDRLKNLPPSSIVLRFSFFRDPSGESFRVDEQVELITAAGLPVYDFWDEGIGSGYVGGYVVTGESQGQVVASMLKRILAGEAPENIEVVDRSPNIPVFDKRELLRNGADLSQLPPNAVLRFDEPSFWLRYRSLLVGTGIAFLVLLGFAIFFAVLSVQRKRHAVALSLEEQKLRATLQSIGEGVVTTNTRGEIEQINAVAERWLGLPLEKVYGRPADSIFQMSNGTSGTVTKSSSRRDPAASGLLMTSAGNSLPIVRTAAPISLSGGEKGGTVIVFRDMTRENELQQELEQVRRLNALGQLAGGVAHDFNNMLAGIMGAAELLKGNIDDDELGSFPQLILDSASDAADLTTQLLSFASEQPIDRQPVHVHQIINDSVAVLTRTIDPRVEIDVRADAEIDVVHGDRTLLKSCLLNLGINASHAMPSGGTLIFSTRVVNLEPSDCEGVLFEIMPGPYLELRVEDTGAGISPEIIERIFEPFFTTKEPGKGTGLGLAAVFGTVQQHDGSVSVDSEVGQGACFTVRLPLASQPVSAASSGASVPGEGVVLVVDDWEPLQKVTRKHLEFLGYEVLTANDGLEALEVYTRADGQVDVVLLDMIMPKMDGRDCFIELKRLDPNVRVIAISGFSCPERMQELQGLGVAVQLKKPFGRTELSKALRSAISTAS